MRLFVALEIPSALRQELDRRCRALRDEHPKARWVRPEAMHLTLSFLGETSPEVLPALHRELEAAFAASAPFELRLGPSGVFPPRGKVRVVWTSLVDGRGEPCEALSDLRSSVADAVFRGAGVEPDRRPFHPHVTLARCSPPWARSAAESFLEELGDPPQEVFEIAEGILFESELHPTGARYRVARTYPLGGAP